MAGLKNMYRALAGPGGPPADPLDNTWTTAGAGGSVWTYIDFNRHTLQALLGGSKVYMEIATFNFEQFGAGLINTVQSVDPAVVNLDNNRYRCRRLSGDEATSSTFFATNLGIGVWSAWRGGNPGAPLQSDSVFYSFTSGFTGTLAGTWEVQVEQPDGSSIIVVDRTFSLNLTKT